MRVRKECQTDHTEESPKYSKSTEGSISFKMQEPPRTPQTKNTDSVPPPDHMKFEFSGVIMEVKDILKKQRDAINKLTIQTETLQQEQQQEMKKKKLKQPNLA